MSSSDFRRGRRLTIADTIDDAIMEVNTVFHKKQGYGGSFDASWMRPEDVSKEVRACLDEYLVRGGDGR